MTVFIEMAAAAGLSITLVPVLMGYFIRVKVTPEEVARLSRPESIDPQALDAYLRGRHHMSRRSADSFDEARQIRRRLSVDGDDPPAREQPRAARRRAEIKIGHVHASRSNAPLRSKLAMRCLQQGAGPQYGALDTKTVQRNGLDLCYDLLSIAKDNNLHLGSLGGALQLSEGVHSITIDAQQNVPGAEEVFRRRPGDRARHCQ